MRTALGVATAVGAAVGVMGVSGAGTAAAQAAPLTLKYTCKVPVIGNQPFTAKIDADLPASVAVGESSPKFAINAGTTVQKDLTPWLGRIGVKTVEGIVEANIGVAAPQGDRHVKAPLHIAKTSVPASGAFDVTAAGAAPALTFSQPGNARITVGDIRLHVVGKKADGSVRGKLDLRCTLDSEQKDVVGSFEITGAGTTTGSTTSGTSGTTSSGGTTAGGTPDLPSTDGSSTPTGASPHGHGKSTIAATGQDLRGLILPTAGVLVAGVVAFLIGSRLRKRRHRASDDA